MGEPFERERAWWNAKASSEEQDRADEAINRALRWREIERHLAGVETILDAGGGTGAFSIPLARRGYRVTHLDLSPAMIEIARERARGLDSIDFVEGNAVDLSRYPGRSFDLVLNTDGAVSFCGAQAERALAESCRVARRRLIATVSNRADLVPSWIKTSVEVFGRLLPTDRAMLERGEWDQDAFPENAHLAKGSTLDYVAPIKAFTPPEVRELLGRFGMRPLRVGGLGSLANLCGVEFVQRVLTDESLVEPFLDACETYDRDVLPDGPGTLLRAGLIAIAEPLA